MMMMMMLIMFMIMMMMTSLSNDDNDDDDDDNAKEEKVGVVLYAPPTQVTTGTQVCSCIAVHHTLLHWFALDALIMLMRIE